MNYDGYFLECSYCNYTRHSDDDGRTFDEQPTGELVCKTCMVKYLAQCDCCLEWQPKQHVGYTSRNGIDYCQGCWDSGCDLETCSRIIEPARPSATHHIIERKLRHKRKQCEHCRRDVPVDEHGRFTSHDNSSFTRQLCAGTGTVPLDPPSAEELAEVYRSLGVEPD